MSKLYLSTFVHKNKEFIYLAILTKCNFDKHTQKQTDRHTNRNMSTPHTTIHHYHHHFVLAQGNSNKVA